MINAPDVKAWAKVFSKSIETEKSHSMFQQQIILGNTAFIERDWDKAINFYNQALSFVERHTVSECILYANRAQCFHQLSLFGKALIDSDLALGSAMHVSDHVLMQLCSLRTEIARLDANQKGSMDSGQPKIDFNPNVKFPCMINGLEIAQSEEFGRYILSSKNIAVGQTVFIAEPFAAIALPSQQVHCSECIGVNMNFVPCSKCTALFCENCVDLNGTRTHDLVCGTNIDEINDIDLKLIIKSAIVAISMFSNVEHLMMFVENIMFDPSNLGKIPESSVDCKSKYAVFLGLVQSEKNLECLLNAYLAFKFLAGVPKLKDWFNTERKRRFLSNVLVHHAAVIPKNMFADTYNHSAQIYDVLSLFNHSCMPQLKFKQGNTSELVTCRQIQQGEQVFIDYLCGTLANEDDLRKACLKNSWGFECQCCICSF